MNKEESKALILFLFNSIVPDIDPEFLKGHESPHIYAKRLTKAEFLKILEMKEYYEQS